MRERWTNILHTHTHTALLPPSTLSLHTHTSLARTHTPPFLLLLLYSATGAVPAHLSLFQDVPTCISTALSPLPPLCSSAPCHLSHEWRLFAIGSFTEADRDKDRDKQHSPASVNAILCRLFAVLPFLFIFPFPSADYLITSCRLTTLAIVKFRFAKGNAYNYSKLIVAQWYANARLQRIEVTVLKQLRCVCIKP